VCRPPCRGAKPLHVALCSRRVVDFFCRCRLFLPHELSTTTNQQGENHSLQSSLITIPCYLFPRPP
jgi:hypothetical protein